MRWSHFKCWYNWGPRRVGLQLLWFVSDHALWLISVQWWYWFSGTCYCNPIFHWCFEACNYYQLVPVVWQWKGKIHEHLFFNEIVLSTLTGTHVGDTSRGRSDVLPIHWLVNWVNHEWNLHKVTVNQCMGDTLLCPQNMPPYCVAQDLSIFFGLEGELNIGKQKLWMLFVVFYNFISWWEKVFHL